MSGEIFEGVSTPQTRVLFPGLKTDSGDIVEGLNNKAKLPSATNLASYPNRN